jgi:UDP-N-acetylglucosamine--N-acetylmuramyl-(pentapeptide) pyrophosphoryl-undecaprenol N-acetylglucosamine transferase
MSEGGVILLAGGGSGGHLYPGIAVAQALTRIEPALQMLFLCTDRSIDKTILAPTGFEFIQQPILPPRRSVGGLIRFWRSWRATHELVDKVLRQRKPRAVLGLGGYAAGVAVKYSSKARVPAAILNPDVIPGKANQYLLEYVSRVCCQFDATREHVSSSHQPKLRTTGCPIRLDMLSPPVRAEAAGRLGLDPIRSTLVVTGASQGAVTVNEAVIETLRRLIAGNPRALQGWQLLHLAGTDHGEAVRAGYRAIGLEARVIDFTPDMADVWAVADLVVSRAGASTCAELSAVGIASVLMPYPFHKDQHQAYNADVFVRAGAAVKLADQRDAKKNADALEPLLQSLIHDEPRRREMARAARGLARPDAADAVARTVIEMVQGR